MKAIEFERELQNQGMTPASFCPFVQRLRDFLDRAVPPTTGIRGRILKAMAPSAVRGIRDVVEFLDEYLDRNCGSVPPGPLKAR